MKQLTTTLGYVSILALLIGCGTQSTVVEAPSQPTTDIDGSHLLLAAEPESLQDVITAREEATNDQPIAIVGRIGGSQNPWVKDRSAFSLVDLSLKACSDPEKCSNCPTPWDYCCELNKLPTGTAFVKFTDENGKLIPADARALLAVKELDTVVVQGTAKRDDAGNLTVIASGLFKKPSHE